MANRSFRPMSGALEKGVVCLYARVDIGATGAPTLDADQSLGVASIARNSAGDYTITLEDSYNRLLNCNVMQLASSAEDLTFQMDAQSVSTATGGTIGLVCKAAAVATDPSDGSDLYIKLELKNSGIK